MKVLVMAGGTGGHVFPALAVAELLRARGVAVEWLGSEAGLEARVVPASGLAFHAIPVRGLRGKGLVGWLAAPWRVARAVRAALAVLARARPQVVLGMGGYAAGPGGLAAWLRRLPLVVHEQNAVPGLTNRILARLAHTVLEGFPGAFPSSVGARHTGNPLRSDIAALATRERGASAPASPLRLLVLGGSQGARVLNEVVPAALASLAGSVVVRHQAGERNLAAARAAYAAYGLGVEPLAFIDDMAASYAWADLVLCRAGAMTVTEVAAVGVGAVLVPFPHAVDDHQSANARYLGDVGAAVVVPESELSPARLAGLLADLAAARERVAAMAAAARRVAVIDAGERVADACLEAARA
jgi:UDP-N-acetylglucosamine--N-acetylmuramyl-(pentapeptide) pyrophosphoryl-undecaprenol N-acetylglucosamine transferase